MISGIINIYKEKGYTSHDVVAKLRGIFKQKKIGHTGTLDPDAEGVLPVCLGRATKVCDLLTEKDKVYRAALLLGTVTDTQDATGTVLCQNHVGVTQEQVQYVLEGFVGMYEQVPPMYSALKVNGRKLYELAREGITVERKARQVEIYSIRMLSIALPIVEIEVHCSKGTYVRTLCHDVGEKLGCGGCMQSLLRTRVGFFDIGQSMKLQEVEAQVREGDLSGMLLPVDEMFSSYEKLICKPEYDNRIHNGNPVGQRHCIGEGAAKGERVRLYDSEGRFVGIYDWEDEKGQYMPVKIFWETE